MEQVTAFVMKNIQWSSLLTNTAELALAEQSDTHQIYELLIGSYRLQKILWLDQDQVERASLVIPLEFRAVVETQLMQMFGQAQPFEGLTTYFGTDSLVATLEQAEEFVITIQPNYLLNNMKLSSQGGSTPE
jgi:hypothetical protein